MARVIGMVAAVLAAMAVLGAQAQIPAPAAEPFVVGVAPHTSARIIIEQYQPVRAALAQSLGRPVEIVTAPDFTEFARRAMAQEYDLAVTTGHQAELLRSDAGYLPLVTYQADFRAVLVVDRGAAVTKPDGLNGQVVLGLSPSSLVTLWGVQWLRDNGVAPRQTRFVSAADSVAQLVLAGDAAGGFMSLANFQKLPPDAQAGLRILESSRPLAGRVYLLNGRHGPLRGPMMAALKAFAGSQDGKRYFQDNKLEGYREIGDGELAAMAPYADEVRTLLRDERK